MIQDYSWFSLLESYKKYVFKEAAVLEIGASNYLRTRKLAEYCAKLIGVEFFPERIPPDFQNVTYLKGDWQKLSEVIPKESIDLAISSHVIEHVPEDLKALNELYAVLKPGGVAIFDTPNRKRLVRAVLELFTGQRKFPWWEHVREYTESELEALIKNSSFKRFDIVPIVFGIHAWPILFYLKKCPRLFRRYANFLEVHLFKNE